MQLEVHNSFCRFTGEIPEAVSVLVKEVLTYKNDIFAEKNSLMNLLKWARKECQSLSNKPGASPGALKKAQNKLNGYQYALKKLIASEIVCWYRDGAFPTGHLNIVFKALEALGAVYEIVDHRQKPEKAFIFNWVNEPHPLRYYQAESVKIGLETGRGVFEEAVGTGKSLILAHLVKELGVRSLIIVPSKALANQLLGDFRIWFGAGKVQQVKSEDVKKGVKLKPIMIIIINTLASLQKSGDLEGVLRDVDAVFVDETHHTGADSFLNLMPEINHIYYRFGFTGTFLRNDGKFLDMWGFLSNVIYRYPAKQAIADGFLTPMTVKLHVLDGIANRKYPKEYDANYCVNVEMLRTIKEILRENPGDQILILVNRKDKCGLMIHEFLISEGLGGTYISGDDDKDTIQDAIDGFNEKRIRVLIGSGVIGEGVDICSTDRLIMCQGGKSEIVIVQGIGRGIRLYEGKKHATIHDFYFQGTNYMCKHAEIRLDIYERNFGCEVVRM